MRPANRLFLLVTLWGGLGLAWSAMNWADLPASYDGARSTLETLWQGFGLCLLLLSLFDSLAYWRGSPVQVTRQVTDSVALDHWTPVTLTFENQQKRGLNITFFDHHPPEVDTRNARGSLSLNPKERILVRYEVKAFRRGNLKFQMIDLLIPSLLGLWVFRHKIRQEDTIKVYPNFSAVAQYTMLSTEQQTAQMGIRLQQRRGLGLEFHQLREFRQGDSLRQIDWNASARVKKLISKEYQDETDQQIIFLLDCGRNMRSKDQRLSHFDHALNALLLMSHVALKQGDSVGLLSFSGEQRWIKPVKGSAQVPNLLHQVYDLQSTRHTSDYLSAANQLMTKQNKRSLVIIISSLYDEFSDDLQQAVRLLNKKHLVLFANLEDPSLREVASKPVTSLDSSMVYSGVIEYLERRKQIEQQLNQQGLITANCLPRELHIHLINKYFEIKRENLL